jgi:hypothetical protein
MREWPLYALDRRLDGPQRRYGRYREEKILNLLGLELRLLDCSVRGNLCTDRAFPVPWRLQTEEF